MIATTEPPTVNRVTVVAASEGFAALDRPLDRAMAARSDGEQGDRKQRIRATERDVGRRAAWSRRGASRPTPSAPAMATEAVRHHASQVRSAAILTLSAVSASAGCRMRSATAAMVPHPGAPSMAGGARRQARRSGDGRLRGRPATTRAAGPPRTPRRACALRRRVVASVSDVGAKVKRAMAPAEDAQAAAARAERIRLPKIERNAVRGARDDGGMTQPRTKGISTW